MLGYSSKMSGGPIGTQSALDFYSRKNRVVSYGSTQGSIPKFNTKILPEINRSSSTSSKSTKLRLITIEGTLSAMDQDLHQLKGETRVTFELK